MSPESGDVDDDRSPSPLDELADEVAERRGTGEDPLWEELKDGGDGWFEDGGPDDEFLPDDVEVVEGPAPSTPVEGGDVDGVYTVSKRDYCLQCPHFSTPPEVHCTHDGTSIVSFADSEQVRVKDCPMIDERDV